MDWSATPLGPRTEWPQALSTAVEIMLGSRYAMWIGWGPELTFLYNDAYAEMTLGPKHPWALGRPAREVWSEIWQDVGPRAESVMKTGIATWDEKLLLFVERRGFPEESYHTFSYSALPPDQSGVGGMLCVVTEESESVISERRLNCLQEIAARTVAEVRSVSQACLNAATILQNNLGDVPFSLIYRFDEQAECAILEGFSGLDGLDDNALKEIDITDETAILPLQKVVRSGGAVPIDNIAEVVSGAKVGVWPELPINALVFPLEVPGQPLPAGFLVVAASPRLVFDTNYRRFLDLVASQIASAIASARAYETERQRAESLVALDKAKVAFFSNVSHEFRTPLTLMLGPIEDVLREHGPTLSEQVKGNLEIVNRNALRLLRLVNSLLDFSRIEAGRSRALYQLTEISTFTSELASVFRSAMERGGLQLVIDCPPCAGPVYVDREMWEKVMLNLLSNAFKFTFEGFISVSVHQHSDTVDITVADTGIGVAERELPHLFDRFHRVENVRSRTHEGSGIGLALVKELVSLHGGIIEVESSLEKGTKFTVKLPTGKQHLPADQIADEIEQPTTTTTVNSYLEEAMRWLPEAESEQVGNEPSAGGTEVLEEAERPLVVVADDNADMRNYMVRLLSERFRVIALEDGEAVLGYVRTNKPDLILTDVMMPRLDGFGLLKALRKKPDLQQIPVILLSARAGEECRVEGMDAGADDYMVKPFSARELVARVDANLRISKLRRESTDALLQREEQLQLALDVARMVYWEWEPATDSLVLSKNAKAVFGLLSEDLVNTFTSGIELVYPDDRAIVSHILQRAAKQGREFHVEFRLLRPDSGETVWLEEWGYAELDESGNTRRLVGVAMDVTQRKESDQTLQHSKNYLRAIIETTPECIKIVDESGTLLQMNNAGQEMIEAGRGTRVAGGCVYDLIAPEHRDAFKAFNEAVCHGKRGTLEFDIIGFKGTRRHMETHAVPLRQPSGKLVQLALTRDVSERKKIERDLLIERDYLSITLRSIGDAVITTDTSACITNMNGVAESLTGWTLGEAKGKRLQDVFHIINETTRKPVENPALKAISDGVIVGLANHTILVSKSGSETPIDDSAAPIKDDKGQLHGSVLVFRDISERKKIEEILRASEAHFRNMADNAPAMLWVTDPDGVCIFLSQGWYDFTGQTEEEGMGYGWLEAVHPDDRESSGEIFLDANRKRCEFSLDYRLRNKDGEYRWAIDSGRPRFDDQGKFAGFIGSVTDMHERKLAEDFRRGQAQILEMITKEQSLSHALIELVRFVEGQIEDAIGSILLLDADGQHLLHGAATQLSQRYTDAIHGMRIGPNAGSCGTAIFENRRVIVENIPEDPLWQPFRELAEEEGVKACWSEPIRSSDGVPVGTFAIYFRNARSQSINQLDTLEASARFAGIVIDRARAQERLRKREQRFSAFTQASSDLVFQASSDWSEVQDLDSGAASGSGSLTYHNWLERHIHPEDRQTFLDIIEDATQRKVMIELEHRVIRNDGGEGWSSTRAIPIINDGQGIIEWFGAVTDITERKTAQEAQRRYAETFASLVQQSPVGIYVVDSQFRIILTSVGSEPAFRNVQPVIGRDFAEVMHTIWPADFANEAIAVFRHTLETGEPYVAPGLTENRKDLGDQESYEWQVNRTVLADGQFGVVCYYYDTTRLQDALTALRASEERFRMLADNMSQLAWICNDLGDVSWFNQRWLNYSGMRFEDVRGWGWQEVVHPDYLDEVVESIDRARSSGEVWEHTFPLRSDEGSYSWFLTRALPIVGDDGQIVQWFGTNTDISELRETQQLLQAADERKNEFLATLAHELRNPLAPIRTGLELLKMGQLNATNYKETLSTMERQTLQLITLVDDLLDVSRITRGKLVLRKSSVELSGIVESAIEASLPVIEGAGHKFTFKLPETPVYLQADPHRLAQVLSNILNNAAKYTQEGGNIDLIVEPETERVTLRVRDDGVGIPAEMLDKIFDMFEQIEHPIENTYAGLGIGLTLVKRLLEMHDGSITVKSEGSNRGSEFVVTLPVLVGYVPENKDIQTEEEVIADAVSLSILIADDNKDAASTLSQLVEMLGNEVTIAHDGLEAIRRAEEVRPEVILMDIGMPNLNGYEATREIRQHQWGRDITIIALTGWGQAEDRKKSAEAGFDYHLVKPLDLAELTALLSTLSVSPKMRENTD